MATGRRTGELVLAFDESQHPRDEAGKFTSAGGGEARGRGAAGGRLAVAAEQRVKFGTESTGNFIREVLRKMGVRPTNVSKRGESWIIDHADARGQKKTLGAFRGSPYFRASRYPDSDAVVLTPR